MKGKGGRVGWQQIVQWYTVAENLPSLCVVEVCLACTSSHCAVTQWLVTPSVVLNTLALVRCSDNADLVRQRNPPGNTTTP
jgi:hypothetical protein